MKYLHPIRFVLIIICFLITLTPCHADKSDTKNEQKQIKINHADNVLMESIGLETLGGILNPIIKKGTKIPASRKQSFSTAIDNQPKISIHVLAGNSEKAINNRTIGMFELEDIPLAPRGDPNIEVTFKVDRKGNLSINAVELNAGKELILKKIDADVDMKK